jgi:hypothetical protein
MMTEPTESEVQRVVQMMIKYGPDQEQRPQKKASSAVIMPMLI